MNGINRVLRVAFPIAFAAVLLAACDSGSGSQASVPVAPISASPVAATSATAHPTATPAPTLAPTPKPKPAPVAVVVAAKPAPPPPPPPPAPAFNYCGAPANPWHYNFCAGNVINSPPSSFCSYFPCIPSFWKSTNGYAEECVDGEYSHSGGRPGACSYHGGEMRPLLQ